MDDDIEIFKGKKFTDLCKDIYTNSQHTRNQIEILISEVRGQITDLLNSGIKNDDHLIKLASVTQRIMANHGNADVSGGAFELTAEERNQLMAEVEKVQADVKNIKAEEVKAIESDESDTSES